MKSLGSMIETDNEKQITLVCEDHGKFTGKAIRIMADMDWRNPECPECAETRNIAREKERRAEQDSRKRAHVQSLRSQANIPKRFIGRTLDNYRATESGQEKALKVAARYAETFETRLKYGGGIVLCGKPGTGKTHLSVAIADKIMRTGRSAKFLTVIKAIRSVKETYRKDSEKTEGQAIQDLAKPDLLILDEIGVQFGTDTEKLILFEILNERYQQMKPTIVISNLDEVEVIEYLGSRVVDRLREGGGAVVAFDWESYRPKVMGDENLNHKEPKAVKWPEY